MKTPVIYYDGKTSAPQEVLAWYDAEFKEIVLEKAEKSIRWPIAEVRYPEFKSTDVASLDFGRFPAQTIEYLENSSFGKELQANLPARKEGFGAFGNELVNEGWGGGAIIMALVVAALLGVYFYVLPFVSEQIALTIPQDTEVKFGEKIFESLVEKEDIDAEKTAKLRSFTDQLDFKDAKYKYDFYVVDDDLVNAFALPGGKVVIYDGLLQKLKKPEELVGLLGHECTHIEKKHSLKNIASELSSSFFLAAVFGDAGGISNFFIDNANKMRGMSFGRDMETESDLVSINLLRQNNLPEQGTVDLLKILKKEEEKMGLDIPQFLSSHPLSENRIKELEKNISKKSIKLEPSENLQKAFNELLKEE